MFISISESIENYLSLKNETVSDVDSIYKPKINCFKEYLFQELKFSDNYDGLQKIKQLGIDYLPLSMKYYIGKSKQNSNRKYHVLKISPLDSYFFVIRDYFKFLHKSNILNDKLILEIAKWDEDPFLRNEIINQVALECKLISKQVMQPYNPDEIKKLINECDSTIYFYSNNGVFITKKHQDYKQLTSAVILKLIYYTGVKYRVIKTIKYEDVDLKKSIIRVGNYSINIPIQFSEQLNTYRNFRNKISNASNNPLFFIASQKTQQPYNNTFVTAFLSYNFVIGQAICQ